MRSILLSCMMVKNLQNVPKVRFQPVLMTFISDFKIDLIMCECNCVLTFDIFLAF